MGDDTSFSLYTGCLIRTRLPHLEKSARMVFDRFGLQLSELAGASCCPDPVGMRGMDQQVWLTMAARNLALGHNNSKPLMTLCSGCYSTFREAQHILKTNTSLREKINHILKPMGCEYAPGPPVEHFASFIFKEIGLDLLSSRITDTWKGLPVAVHHGCHLLRPSHIIGFDDPENPTKLEELIRVFGADVVDYPRKMLCCGFTIQGVDADLSRQMAYEKLKLMKESGAKALVVFCPACMIQFDMNQRPIEQKFDVSIDLPVFYLTEFLGLALGLTPSSLGLNFHRVDTSSIIDEIFPGRDSAPT
ncbi:CoB--CoM heterodisulfide reductase iron-sulfur subunit B family protein [Thermodesulfobacteriota bacterium]